MTKGEIVAAQSRTMARLSGLSPEAQAADRDFVRRALAVTRREPDGARRLQEITAIADEALTKIPEKERAAVEPGIRERVQILASDNFHRDAVMRRRDYLSEVRCPVLALNGGKDVLVSAEENVPRLRHSLERGGNRDATVAILPDLNHMFQTARTGTMEEAEDIEETFAPSALRLIGDWILPRECGDSCGLHRNTSKAGGTHPRRSTRPANSRNSRVTTRLLAFCHLDAGGTPSAADAETEPHLARVEKPNPRTLLTEMRVNAVRIQQTLAE